MIFMIIKIPYSIDTLQQQPCEIPTTCYGTCYVLPGTVRTSGDEVTCDTQTNTHKGGWSCCIL